MVAAVPHPVLLAVLRHLPNRLKAALDDWSYRVAQRRARQRREAALRRQGARG